VHVCVRALHKPCGSRAQPAWVGGGSGGGGCGGWGVGGGGRGGQGVGDCVQVLWEHRQELRRARSSSMCMCAPLTRTRVACGNCSYTATPTWPRSKASASSRSSSSTVSYLHTRVRVKRTHAHACACQTHTCTRVCVSNTHIHMRTCAVPGRTASPESWRPPTAAAGWRAAAAALPVCFGTHTHTCNDSTAYKEALCGQHRHGAPPTLVRSPARRRASRLPPPPPGPALRTTCSTAHRTPHSTSQHTALRGIA
jgi:hypothetical protein